MSNQEFKITMIKIFMALIDKVDIMQEHTGNACRETEILSNDKKMLEI